VSLHVHRSPEDLLELALAQDRGPSAADAPDLDELRACAQCARGLHVASVDLLRVRAALGDFADESPSLDHALAERVLEQTTREDLSWRGDWRMVARFVSGGMRSSLTLRLVAASLILHLLALPVLAVVLVLQLRESRPVWQINYEPALVEELPLKPSPREPQRELVREPEPEPPGPLSSKLERTTRSERTERARRELLEHGAPALSPLAGAGRIERLLDARSRNLSQSGMDRGLSAPDANAQALELALWAELLMDDWLLSARSDPRLAEALARLIEAPNGAAQLVRRALDRASSLGFQPADQPAWVEASKPAFDRAWFVALQQACAEQGLPAANPTLVNWLAWGQSFAR
jgi:hypothetical protein